jgi:hypothetical protein
MNERMVRILVGKYEEKRPFRRCRLRCKKNVTRRKNLKKNRLKVCGVE